MRDFFQLNLLSSFYVARSLALNYKTLWILDTPSSSYVFRKPCQEFSQELIEHSRKKTHGFKKLIRFLSSGWLQPV